jgi:hypothetical protein
VAEPTAVPELTLAQHRDRARAAVDEAIRAVRLDRAWNGARKIPEVAALHALKPEEQRSAAIELLARAVGMSPDEPTHVSTDGLILQSAVTQLYATFANRAIPYTRGDAEILLELAASAIRHGRRNGMEWMALDLVPQPIAALERVVKDGGVGDLAVSIQEAAELLGHLERYDRTKAERYRSRLMALLQTEDGPLDPDTFDDADSWGAAWRDRVSEVPAALRPLVAHLALGGGSVSPPLKWRTSAQELLATPGATDLLRSLLLDVESARLREVPVDWTYLFKDPSEMPFPLLRDRNALVVRGAIWAAALSNASWAAARLGELGVTFGTSGRSDNVARDERVANTCAAALGTLDNAVAFAALGLMKSKVTNRNVSKQIAKALEIAASRRGMSPSELVELSIPTLGLDPSGRREEQIGEEVAVLAIGTDGNATLAWRGPDGQERATPAKPFADAHAADLRRVKDEAKELKKAVALERGRIEDLFVEDREWDLETWWERYVRHPLTGSLGRRLIWRLVDTSATPSSGRSMMPSTDDRLVGADGSMVEAGAGARVRLWHPIDATEAEVDAWRVAILERRIRQPFKQAFREVYRLTPADVASGTTSDRFAAHILLYSQARALMLARRWGTNFLGSFDGGETGLAKHEFPSHGLRAEFRHDAIWPLGPGMSDVTHCTTGHVGFVQVADDEPVPLRDVPPIVFAEAMRDVDLFVGVSSVGADRNWKTAEHQRSEGSEGFEDYWSLYSDAPLQVVARTRRDAIERLLPGLTIADRCELDDRWLRVRGDLRTYRIHLGSGNITMEPTDTYLYIVPTTGGGPIGRVFLPFDDDPMLSLILSKAFLVANDSAIRDRSIASQIRESEPSS